MTTHDAFALIVALNIGAWGGVIIVRLLRSRINLHFIYTGDAPPACAFVSLGALVLTDRTRTIRINIGEPPCDTIGGLKAEVAKHPGWQMKEVNHG